MTSCVSVPTKNPKNSYLSLSFLQTCQLSCWNSTAAIDVEWMSEHKFLVAEASGLISLDSVNPSKMRKVGHVFMEIIGSIHIEILGHT